MYDVTIYNPTLNFQRKLRIKSNLLTTFWHDYITSMQIELKISPNISGIENRAKCENFLLPSPYNKKSALR